MLTFEKRIRRFSKVIAMRVVRFFLVRNRTHGIIPTATLEDFERTALEEQRGWLVRVRERRREATEQARAIITEHVAGIVRHFQLQAEREEREEQEEQALSRGGSSAADDARNHSLRHGEAKQPTTKHFDADDDGGDSEDDDDLGVNPTPLDEEGGGGLRAEALAALSTARASCLSGVGGWAEDLRRRAGALEDSWAAGAAADDRQERRAAEEDLDALGLALRAARREAEAAFVEPCDESRLPPPDGVDGAVGAGGGGAVVGVVVDGEETAAGPGHPAALEGTAETKAAAPAAAPAAPAAAPAVPAAPAAPTPAAAAAAVPAMKGEEVPEATTTAGRLVAEEREECCSLWSSLERPLARLLQPEPTPAPEETAGPPSRGRTGHGREEDEEVGSATRVIGGLEAELRGEVDEAFGTASGIGETEGQEEEVRCMMRDGGEELRLALVPIVEGKRERREKRRQERKRRDLERLLAAEEEERRRREEAEALEAQRAAEEESLLLENENDERIEVEEEKNGEDNEEDEEEKNGRQDDDIPTEAE